MRYEYTDGKNSDFILLCDALDVFLNDLVDGEKNRAQYISYNALDDIHDVVLLYEHDLAVGCASFKKYNDECAEVKRVYIRPEYREMGIGEQLMAELEQLAREKNFLYFILESGEPLVSAMALYRRLGYKVIPNYGQYVNLSDSICMKKKL